MAASNAFTEAIEKIALETFRIHGAAELTKLIDKRVEELVDQLVPVEVARQLHKMLAGEDLPRGGGSAGPGRKGKKAKHVNFVCPRKPHRGRCGPKCRKAAGIPDGKDPVSDIAGGGDSGADD